jgi:hypothetical protein
MSTDPIAPERLFESGNQKPMSLNTNEAIYLLVERPSSGSSSESRRFAAIFRSFGGTFLFALFFIVFCYFVVVTVVNPHRVFWGRSFPEIMPNTRALKLDLLQKYNSAGTVDLVVLGSSRSTKLSPDLLESLTGQRTFNAGVFSARPNDYLSIYRVMKQQGIAPKTLVVGLDAEALDPATPPAPDFDSNLALKSALNGTVPSLPAKIWHWAWLYKKSLTPYYIQDIGKSVWIRINPRPPLFEFYSNGQEEDQVLDTKIRSGAYPHAEKVRDCEDSLQAEFDNFHEASPDLEYDLKQLFSEAASDKVRVVLWITPVHPEALEKILKDPQAGRNFRSAEALLIQLGAIFHLPVRDLIDSQSFGGDPDSWYDCVHYNGADADKIAKELFNHGL